MHNLWESIGWGLYGQIATVVGAVGIAVVLVREYRTSGQSGETSAESR